MRGRCIGKLAKGWQLSADVGARSGGADTNGAAWSVAAIRFPIMSSSKENNPQGAEELPSQASPRVSTAGAGGSEDAGGSQRASQDRPGLAQEGYSGFSHDHLHWGGVGRRPHDARSVASSAAADRDDKSVYDQGLDAHDGERERQWWVSPPLGCRRRVFAQPRANLR